MDTVCFEDLKQLKLVEKSSFEAKLENTGNGCIHNKLRLGKRQYHLFLLSGSNERAIPMVSQAENVVLPNVKFNWAKDGIKTHPQYQLPFK